MKNQDYNTSFLVDQTPEEAFSALIIPVNGGRNKSKAVQTN